MSETHTFFIRVEVSGSTGERSASALRRLCNYTRATTGIEWPSSLALLHVHYDKAVDLDNVVNSFSKQHFCHIELTTLIRPE